MRQALEYVRNANGGASRENFVEDFEPVGDQLWDELVSRDLVEERAGRIFLSAKGERELEQP